MSPVRSCMFEIILRIALACLILFHCELIYIIWRFALKYIYSKLDKSDHMHIATKLNCTIVINISHRFWKFNILHKALNVVHKQNCGIWRTFATMVVLVCNCFMFISVLFQVKITGINSLMWWFQITLCLWWSLCSVICFWKTELLITFLRHKLFCFVTIHFVHPLFFCVHFVFVTLTLSLALPLTWPWLWLSWAIDLLGCLHVPGRDALYPGLLCHEEDREGGAGTGGQVTLQNLPSISRRIPGLTCSDRATSSSPPPCATCVLPPSCQAQIH